MVEIIEEVIEPTKIYVDTTFKLKVRIKLNSKNYTLGDVKKVTCDYLKSIICKDLKEGVTQ